MLFYHCLIFSINDFLILYSKIMLIFAGGRILFNRMIPGARRCGPFQDLRFFLEISRKSFPNQDFFKDCPKKSGDFMLKTFYVLIDYGSLCTLATNHTHL